MRTKRESLFNLVMFWTTVTTVFAWLPLVRIIGRPERYQWSILGASGEGTGGPFWLFILLMLYVVTLLFSAFRGPRALFYPMLILWHLAVTGAVITGIVIYGSRAAWQGHGLHFSIPLWLPLIPCALFAVLAVAWTVLDYRCGGAPAPADWTRANSVRLAVSLLLLVVALGLFRAGTNYNWVTAVAIITTIVHWILLVQSFEPVRGIEPPMK